DKADSAMALGEGVVALRERKSIKSKPPITPPAWQAAIGVPINPKCRKERATFPVTASNHALLTTAARAQNPTRRSPRRIISMAETAMSPWATPDNPQKPSEEMAGLIIAAARLPAPHAATAMSLWRVRQPPSSA